MLPGDLEKKQNQRYRNRSGSVNIRPPWTYYPKNETEISQIIEFSRAQNLTLRPAGAGSSVAPLNAAELALVRLDRMQGLVHVNRDAREAIVWAGTRLNQLSALLAEQGLSLPYPADHGRHTLAGALATGAHGSDAGAGILATRVTALTMVTGRGDIAVYSRKKNPNAFRAALLSLGALGVTTKVSLDLSPRVPVREEMSRHEFDAGLNAIDAKADGASFSEFIYVPHTDKLLQRRMVLEAGEAGKDPGGIFNDMPAGILATATGFVPALARPLSGLAAAFQFRQTASLTTNGLMRKALASGLSMEYGFARDKAAAVMTSLRARFDAQQAATLLPVTIRFAAKDDIHLSPANGRDTCFIAVRAPHGPKGREVLLGSESILREHEGRPSWFGFFSEDQKLGQAFPGWKDFQKVRAELDPDNIFMNEYLKKIF